MYVLIVYIYFYVNTLIHIYFNIDVNMNIYLYIVKKDINREIMSNSLYFLHIFTGVYYIYKYIWSR